MKKAYILTLVLLAVCLTASHAQIPDKFAFGIKAGLNYMDTRLVKHPKNSLMNLIGVRGANGYQFGIWSKIPISQLVFVEADLEYSDKAFERYLPGTDTVVAISRFRFVSLSPRIGGSYKGLFISIGPELSVQVSQDALPPSEYIPLVWGLNTRLGYQYKKIRAEIYYTKGLSPYDENIWDEVKDIRTLYFGNTVGFSLGLQLLGGKKGSR